MGMQNRSFQIFFYVIFSSFMLCLPPSVRGANITGSESLDALLHKYAMESLAKQRTGELLKVSLPSNFSGMELSVIRLRSGSFWERGANFSNFYIPPRVVPFPFVKRLAIVYQNLGNWSTQYYNLPGYTLIAPVITFMAYDAANLSSSANDTLMLHVQGDSILVRFPPVRIRDHDEEKLKCVKFGQGGLVQIRNVTEGITCITEGDGHFSVVVPSPAEKANKSWKWWVVGCVVGFIGLGLLGLIFVTSCKLARSQKMREMEGEAEKGVSFDTTWIGRSKMPSAAMVRTQPAIEHGYVP